MFTIILMLYLQQQLDVRLESASPHGHYKSRAECEAAALKLRGPVPVPHGYNAAWNDALCAPIQPNVRVNDARPSDLATILRAQPASGCQAEGAWRRVAELCQQAPR